MSLPVRPPVAPMLAKLVRDLPDGAWIYEPKWDGFRALAFRDGSDVDLRSRNDRRLARYFPEVVAALLSFAPERFVLDGELVVIGRDGLDFEALLARLHPAASRAARLARETPAIYVAFDLLAIDDDDVRREPFQRRRARLEALLRDVRSAHVMLTPATGDRDTARQWLERFRGGGIDGVMAKDPAGAYEERRRTMIKVKTERTAECVVAGFRHFPGMPVIASLLLGLYDDDDRLVHVGVASQFTEANRRAHFTTLRPLVTVLEGHPWEHGFGLDRSPIGRLHGAAGRWVAGEMDPDWIPVRPERVCEVAYGTVDGTRLRYPARFLRWRPDRDAQSCRLEQLDAAPHDVRALLSA
jgi:ATP-dependent DNA ligase